MVLDSLRVSPQPITPPPLPEPVAGAPVILQVLPRLETGGVERGTVEVTAAIRAAGWRPLVVSEGGRMVREVERAGGEHIALPVAGKAPWLIKRNAQALAAIIAERGVSLVHARSRAPAWSAQAAARAAGIPFVTTFHGTYGFGPFGVKKRYNQVMAMGDRVIAISRFIAQHIQTHYAPLPGGDFSDVVRIIHRGVDSERFDPERVSPERVIQLAQRWRLSDGQPVVMLPGRLTRWKGHLLLLEALSRLPDLDFRCIMVGDDQGRSAYRAEVEQAIDRFGLRAKAQVVEDCNDMPAAYKLADVVVSASTDPEAFGRVVAEGMAMERLVVAPDHGAAPEIVDHGRTGWLFVALNPSSLTAMLRQALTVDAATRAAMTAAARADVRARFTTAGMCAQTLDVYRELLPGAPARV